MITARTPRDDRVPIGGPLREICDALGLEYDRVVKLEITPTVVVADVCALNDEGSKYIDEATGGLALLRRTYHVATW